jgi:WD40 repeat protein
LCNSKRPSVARVGFIDMRAQAELPSDAEVRHTAVDMAKARGATARFAGHRAELGPATVSPDGKTVACGCKDLSIQLSVLQTRALRQTLTGPKIRLPSEAFSRDGKTLASCSGDPAALF